MAKNVRTFVAVETSAAVHEKAGELIATLQGAKSDTKWVAQENLHLTLQFLGDVGEDVLPDVCRAVERGAVGVDVFELELAGVGAFPRIDRPRTLWIGAKIGEPQMLKLHERIANELSKLGFVDETRRYQTHLTIGRVRSGKNGAALAALLREQAAFRAGIFLVKEVAVFASELTPRGPRYTALARLLLL